MKGLHQVGTMREKSVVKVHKTNKLMQLALRLGLWKIMDGLNFLG